MATFPHYSDITVEEYLALERESPDVRYEYVDGHVLMLAGGSLKHSRVNDPTRECGGMS
jgi:hypothetical protein